nr:TRIO and F-actin-binding protein [Ipomoea batatas]
MGIDRWLLLGKLKKAVKKIRVLLNFDLNKWKLASMLGSASGKRRAISFNGRPGLRACVEDSDEFNSAESSPVKGGLQRTTSFPMEEDVDKRAEMFIANFYRQLRLERQISLELRWPFSKGGLCGASVPFLGDPCTSSRLRIAKPIDPRVIADCSVSSINQYYLEVLVGGILHSEMSELFTNWGIA